MARATERASASSQPDVVAAGGVIFRKGRVLLVHRPKYDDWSFPKGKQDPGEHPTATAVREVLEETGVEVRLGRPLIPQLYAVSGGRAKTVHYWIGHVMGGEDIAQFSRNNEIDDIGWFDIEEARRKLSYLDDVAELDHALDRHKRSQALVVLRHARAVKRSTWKGDDRLRPLTRVGFEQAKALTPVLHAYGVTRVLTSSSRRCVQTVRSYAEEFVLPVDARDEFSEEDATVEGVRDQVTQLLGVKESTVLCTHRPVLPMVFDALGIVEEPLAPGELVVVHHRKGRILATERHLVR